MRPNATMWMMRLFFCVMGSLLILPSALWAGQSVTDLSAKQLQELKALLPKAYQAEVMRTDYDAHTVDLQKFQALAAQPGTVILDLRPAEAYAHSHVKGAKHLGTDAEEKRLARLVPRKDTVVLLYCTNSLFLTRMISQTHVVLPQMLALGYKNTYLLDDASRHVADMTERTQLMPMVSTADEQKPITEQKDKP